MANDFFPPLPDDLSASVSTSGLENALTAQTSSLGIQDASITTADAQPTSSRLKPGTWLFTYNRTASDDVTNIIVMDGTFRFDVPDGSSGVRGSGDMYRRGLVTSSSDGEPTRSTPGPAPPNDQGIPIFPIGQYEGYLRVTNVSPNLLGDGGFDLEYDKYKWNVDSKSFTTNRGQALVEETYIVRLTWSTPPSQWQASGDYLTGEVKVKSTGESAGTMSLGQVSSKYRRISVEIDAVRGCLFPDFNTGRKSIWELLEAAGFEVARGIADENSVDDTPSGVWTRAELHAAMLNHRQRQVDLDKEWLYHALMIPKYETARVLGIMYDDVAARIDTNRVAREGFAVVARLPTGSAVSWGAEAGRLLQEAKDSFMRTTIHELSHAMGMQHPNAYDPEEEMDDTYTCQTGTLTEHAREQGIIYPANIKWSHSPVIQTRLKHYPDIRIRPGGVSFSAMGGPNGTAPWVPPNDIAPSVSGLALGIESLLDEVPLGAPVRVRVTLRNDSETALEIPCNIGLNGQAIKGDVMDANGLYRPFQPFIHCADMVEPLSILESGKSITTDLTLFSAAQGPLFPSAGLHTVNVILSWKPSSGPNHRASIWLDAKTTVMVTEPQSASHAAAAQRLFTEPQTQLCIVLGGDHLQDGIDAIKQACDDKVLGPHYASIEAKRCAKSFMDRAPDIAHAKELIERDGVVMSSTERSKLERLCHVEG